MATLAISHMSLDDVMPVVAVIVGDVRIGKAPKPERTKPTYGRWGWSRESTGSARLS